MTIAKTWLTETLVDSSIWTDFTRLGEKSPGVATLL